MKTIKGNTPFDGKLSGNTPFSNESNSEEIMDNKALKLEDVEEFYKWLQNEKMPSGMIIGKGNQPELSQDQAFTIIWFLQEHMDAIPSRYEQCQKCGDLYDTWCEGYTGEYVTEANQEPTSGRFCGTYCFPGNAKPI